MNSGDASAHVDGTPTPERPRCHFQRGANGRYALTDTTGAWLEADAAAFVEIKQ